MYFSYKKFSQLFILRMKCFHNSAVRTRGNLSGYISYQHILRAQPVRKDTAHTAKFSEKKNKRKEKVS